MSGTVTPASASGAAASAADRGFPMMPRRLRGCQAWARRPFSSGVQPEPVVLVRWQGEESLLESLLNRLQYVAAGLLFFRLPLLRDHGRQARLHGRQGLAKEMEVVVEDHPGPRAGSQLQERRVDDALEVARRPWFDTEGIQLGQRREHAGAAAEQAHLVFRARSVQVQLQVDLAARRDDGSDLVQQPAGILPGLHFQVLLCPTVEDPDADPGGADPVTKLGGEVALDLLAAQLA